MFVRNFYKNISAHFMGNKKVTMKPYQGYDMDVTPSASYTSYFTWLMLGSYMTWFRGSASNEAGVSFGTSDEAPTMDDYNLKGTLLTKENINASCASQSTIDDTGVTIIGTYAISNISDKEITINEIGYFAQNGTGYAFLYDRTVLDTPVTIPAGGVGQVTYTIRFNYPTA